VRAIAVLLLIGLLATCPLLCAAAAAGPGPDCCEEADGPAGDFPDSCPGDGVCCICAGAIQSHEVRVPGLEALAFQAPLNFACLATVRSPLHNLDHLTLGGTPTGLAGWGDAAQVRALLQNFRC
jgi:hypothetical protein